MMRTIIYIILALLIGLGIWVYASFNTYAPKEYMVETKTVPTTITTTVNSSTGEITSGSKSYTLSDISTHNGESSCYSVINDAVYDLTMWVNLHPGGASKILSICGIDGTKKFMNKHKGGEKFMSILDRFKIGTLAQ